MRLKLTHCSRMVCFFILLYSAMSLHAETTARIIDIPTAHVDEYGGYTARFRFYSQGGILTRLSFGVLNRVNLGFSWDLEEVIGAETIDVNKPTLNLKIRFWDGAIYFPALAFGYDGQGYFFDETADEYAQREKGMFFAATQEFLLPKFELTAGCNIYDFSEDIIYGFGGFSYTLYPVMIIAEYDNIHHTEFNRINAGIAMLLSSSISVDLFGRDIGAKARDAERVIRINYRGTF